MIECFFLSSTGLRIQFENNEQAETSIRQMVSEVKSRLDVIVTGGRSLVLKIMKWDPCSVEPAKVCSFAAWLGWYE